MSCGPLLIGTRLPPTRALAVTWAGAAGWALSCATLLCLFGPGTVVVLPLAIPAGLLSGGAVYWASRVGTPTTARIMASSLCAACVCPLATLLPVVAFVTAVHEPSQLPEILGAVLCFGVFGAVFTLPLGATYGAIFALAYRAIDLGSRRGEGASLELAGSLFGVGWAILGGVLLGLSLWLPFHPIPEVSFSAATRPNVMTWVAAGLAGAGMLVVLASARRLVHRLWLAERARRGALPGFAVVPLADVEDAWLLPRLFPLGAADAVLVRRDCGGPFREAPDRPLARMAH